MNAAYWPHRRCDSNEAHERHEFIDGARRYECPGRERVYRLVHTVTETYYYDPVQLAEKLGITTAEEVIEFFEQHDGSVYANEFFDNDANPKVGIELEVGWDDD